MFPKLCLKTDLPHVYGDTGLVSQHSLKESLVVQLTYSRCNPFQAKAGFTSFMNGKHRQTAVIVDDRAVTHFMFRVTLSDGGTIFLVCRG